jgi:hypothetical protein
LPVLHLWGVGLGVMVACIVEGSVLGRRASQLTGARIVAPMAGPVLAGAVAGTAGWLLATETTHTLLAAAAAGAVAVGAYALVLALMPNNLLAPTLATVRRALSSTR